MNIIAIRKSCLFTGQTIHTVRKLTQLFSCSSGTSINLDYEIKYFMSRLSFYATFLYEVLRVNMFQWFQIQNLMRNILEAFCSILSSFPF